MTISSLTNSSHQSSPSNVNPSSTPTHSVNNKVRDTLLVADTKGMSPAERRQAALQIVDKTLAQAYEKIASRGQAAGGYSAFEPLTAEKVAANILGFIERRLQLDVADGATPEQLQSRLEAGLSGFKKGFAEASEKLEALSLLSPDIKTDIGKTYDLVLEGIDALRAKFITSLTDKDAAISSPSTAASALTVPSFMPAPGSSASYANYEYARAREFSFELTTREGDKVVIKAASSEGLAVEAGRVSANGRSVSVANASYSASQSFSLSIEGDLNDAERTAIEDLLGQVHELAGRFFDGDLEGAFAQAMSLGYDSTQIGRFALNLAQAEIQQVTKAYQTFEPVRANPSEQGGGLNTERLLPLGHFIRDLLDTLDKASLFPEPVRLLTDMARVLPQGAETEQQPGQRFSDFLKTLLELPLRA